MAFPLLKQQSGEECKAELTLLAGYMPRWYMHQKTVTHVTLSNHTGTPDTTQTGPSCRVRRAVWTGWRRGVLVSGVRRMNEVTHVGPG